MIYLQLLLCFLKIGFFGFGGGYAMLSFIYHETVTNQGWVTGSELADIIAISQMTPGPVAINAATYIGFSVGGIWGSLLATAAVCTPAMTLMLLITKYFLRLRGNRYLSGIMESMHPIVVGMIGAAALTLIFPEEGSGGESFVDIWSWVLFALALVAAISKRVSIIAIILIAAAAGIAIYYLPTALQL